jgi:hypothetical protein
VTDWREELVEKMADGMFASDENGTLRVDVMARAALKVAEPVIREQCAKICDRRYMGDNNREDMEARRCAAAIREGGKDDI